eukprot:TRINITY_DN4930_c0_g4_i2.p4 TRINITY_DN4930_c0_g4~~TRINITY_DN4930_c0_g4_i2.p4  ORF type:complete len:107 (-),score=7.96 TRINITY_DN4930_c0_g4_i2:1170-1490(-)
MLVLRGGGCSDSIALAARMGTLPAPPPPPPPPCLVFMQQKKRYLRTIRGHSRQAGWQDSTARQCRGRRTKQKQIGYIYMGNESFAQSHVQAIVSAVHNNTFAHHTT